MKHSDVKKKIEVKIGEKYNAKGHIDISIPGSGKLFLGLTMVALAVLLILDSLKILPQPFENISAWGMIFSLLFLAFGIRSIITRQPGLAILSFAFVLMMTKHLISELTGFYSYAEMSNWGIFWVALAFSTVTLFSDTLPTKLCIALGIIVALLREPLSLWIGLPQLAEVSSWTILGCTLLLTVGVRLLTPRKYSIKNTLHGNWSGNGVRSNASDITKYIDCASFEMFSVSSNAGDISIFFENTLQYRGGGTIKVSSNAGDIYVYAPANWKISTDVRSSLGDITYGGADEIIEPDRKTLNLLITSNAGDIRIVRVAPVSQQDDAKTVDATIEEEVITPEADEVITPEK